MDILRAPKNSFFKPRTMIIGNNWHWYNKIDIQKSVLYYDNDINKQTDFALLFINDYLHKIFILSSVLCS